MEQEQVEKTARLMGWSPLEDFRGDPDNWIEADKFVERGTTHLPILKENLDRALDKLDKITTKFEQTEKDIKVMADYNKKSDERAFERAERQYETEIKDLKAQLRQSVVDEDIEKFDQVEAKIESLEKPEKADIPPAPVQSPAYQSWLAENAWYTSDPQMAGYADSVTGFVTKNYPNISEDEWYRKITEETKARFPDKFKNPNREKPNAVDGGDDNPAPLRKGSRKFANLDEESKAGYERLKVRIPALTEKEYLANCSDENFKS